MKQVSTLFLTVVIYLLGLLAISVCVIIAGVAISGNAGMYLPILIGIFFSAMPFLYALAQGVLLLRAIDKNVAFTEQSVHAITRIEYCAFIISALYAAMMPYILHVAQIDDAPGAALMGMLCIIAPLITGVFAAVLQRLLQNAIDIKNENELTV